jgi:Reverse transcriptase (RNA-dependent DNA polymerase)
MTMGLKNAGAFFQRLVNKIYAGLKGDSLQAYLDDVVVGSTSPRDHIRDVRGMLGSTRQANLRLKFAQCVFGKREVEVLGHKVTGE